MIDDLSCFRVVLTFDYGLGFNSTTLSSPLNGAFSEYTFLLTLIVVFVPPQTQVL